MKLQKQAGKRTNLDQIHHVQAIWWFLNSEFETRSRGSKECLNDLSQPGIILKTKCGLHSKMKNHLQLSNRTCYVLRTSHQEKFLPHFHTRFERIEKRRVRRLPLSVLTLCAVFGLASFGASRAEATCGDYLSHHDMVGHDQVSMPGGDQPIGGNSQRMPCHGPSCHQGPMELPPSTPVVSFEPQDRWGWIASVVIPALNQTSFLAAISEPVVLPMISFRLDRPPKA